MNSPNENPELLLERMALHTHKIFDRIKFPAKDFIIGFTIGNPRYVTIYVTVWLTPTQRERLYIVNTLHTYFNQEVRLIPVDTYSVEPFFNHYSQAIRCVYHPNSIKAKKPAPKKEKRSFVQKVALTFSGLLSKIRRNGDQKDNNGNGRT